jgi:hypothetical protein
MELETLKKSWETLDRKMQHATAFSQKLVESIISARVMTTVDKIRRLNNFFYVVLGVEILFLIALFVGNPFDFQYTLQYVPYLLILIGVLLAFVNLLRLSTAIRKLSPGDRIDHYLKGIVSLYDRNKRFEKWFGVIFLSIGLLVPASFLPQKLERMNLMSALLDTGIMVSVTLVIYVIAFKLGAFKNPHKAQLEKDLAEWNELKMLANEMNDIHD